MFSVMWVNTYQDNVLFQAERVIRGADEQNRNGQGWQVEFYNEGAQRPPHDPIQFGSVYVMNDAGKTVATYNLPMFKSIPPTCALPDVIRRCTSCQTTWEGPKSVPKTCPSCGAPGTDVAELAEDVLRGAVPVDVHT